MANFIRAFTKQQDHSDCGVACLLTIIKFYDGYNTLENLRRLSGTNSTGTTLLGLYQAANKNGFDAEGCEASIDNLVNYFAPCILYAHTNHYVVCFGTEVRKTKQYFVIGDPAKGILYLTRSELEIVWVTRKCLRLLPNESFKKLDDTKNEKRKWIYELIKKDTSLLLIAAALGIVIATLGLVMTIFSQKLIDEILPKKELLKLNLGVILVMTLLVIKEGLTALRQFFLLRQGKDFNVRIIDFFYNHLLNLPKSFFDTRKIGDLTARLNDTARIQRVISQLAGNVVIDSLISIFAIVFIFFYSWQTGLACLVCLPFFYFLIHLHNIQIIEGQGTMMGSYALAESNYISTLQGIEPIKNYNKQIFFTKINNEIYHKFQHAIIVLGKIQIKLSFLANSFGGIFLVSVLMFNSYQVFHKDLKVGELMAILGMCGTLLPSVANLALILIPINEAKIAFDRMFEFTASESEKNSGKLKIVSWEKLSVRNVSFRFVGRPSLIKNVNFELSKGESIAIIGENGCGKSTLTQLLQKHYNYESGQIIINNANDIIEIDTNNWRNIVGTIPQHVHLFNGTVLENIAFDDVKDNFQGVLDFLEQYEFTSFINSLPQSFMTVVGEEGVNLSGGQKQIIALARALYFKPQLLILDEATAAMDRHSEQFVLKLLRKLKTEMGIIFITHRLHVLRAFCDRIYILEQGEITNSGTHENLLMSENLYSSYWNNFSYDSQS